MTMIYNFKKTGETVQKVKLVTKDAQKWQSDLNTIHLLLFMKKSGQIILLFVTTQPK
jgi:hypothetical protein